MNEPIVFDNEPLYAAVFDEDGSDIVTEYLAEVHRGERAGYASIATWTELLYTVARMIPWDDAVSVVELLERQNVVPIAVQETWYEAARFKHDYTVALGDAFALAAAEHIEGTLLVGADNDFDEVDEVQIERFREESV
jgi:predicted nucleic acid-binding protein